MHEAVVDILARVPADDVGPRGGDHGAGEKAFVSGADISEFESNAHHAEARARVRRCGCRRRSGLQTCEKPIIAMIRGFCIGGGLLTALQADIRYADDGQFAMPAARLGLGYSPAGRAGTVEPGGPGHGHEILSRPAGSRADEARAMGLVNRVVPVDGLDADGGRAGRPDRGQRPPHGKGGKAAIAEVVKDPDRRDLGRVDQMIEACFQSADYIEGRTAFMEKRTPQFTGR